MPSYQCRGKTKLWSVRFEVIENGKIITKRISEWEGNKLTRKKDAETAYRKYMEKYEQVPHYKYSYLNIQDKNFKDVFNNYKIYKKDKLKDSSYYDEFKLADNHIIPYFEKYKIKDITQQIVTDWQNSKKKYSYDYRCKMRSVLFNFFEYIFFNYNIPNILLRVEPVPIPKGEIKEKHFWTYEEFTTFINTFDDNDKNDLIYKTFYTFTYYMGTRLGETCAINYKDIDFKNKAVHITKSITYKISKEEKEKNNIPYKITTPKTSSSNRVNMMPDALIEQLKKYINNYPESKTSTFLFGFDKPLSEKTLNRKKDDHIAFAEVKRITNQEFRHSHASLISNATSNVLLLAKRLGHKDVSMTLNTYSHLFPNFDRELVEKINSLQPQNK